jgi:DksA/TraR C4-type zinc finger protein
VEGIIRGVGYARKGGFMSDRNRPCEICGQSIDPERIEAVPETRLCTVHAKMIGKYGGEFIMTGTQKSLAKGGSFKKNYGDVSVEKERNTKALEKLHAEFESLSRTDV